VSLAATLADESGRQKAGTVTGKFDGDDTLMLTKPDEESVLRLTRVK